MKKSFKKALSLFLSVLMVLSVMLPMGAFSVSAEPISATASWYETETSTELGDKNASTLFIDDANDLLAFATELTNGKTYDGKTVTLTKDIDFNPGYTGGIDKPENVWPDTSGKKDNAWKASFHGVFDGAGNTISGIYYEPAQANAGLFGNLESKATNKVEIKNLAIVNSFIYLSAAKDYCGTLFGNVSVDNKVDITNVYLDVTIRHGNNIPKDGGRVGGFVSFVATAGVELNFKNCVFAGDIMLTRTSNDGNLTGYGVTGKNDDDDVQTWSGGFIGYANNAGSKVSFTDCAFYGKLTETHNGSQFVSIVQNKPTTPYSFTNCVAGGYVATSNNTNYAFSATRNSHNTFTNCYYTNGASGHGTTTLATGSETPSVKSNEEISALTFNNTWKVDEVGNAPLPAYIADTFDTEVYIAHKGWYDANDADGKFEISTPGQLVGFAELLSSGTTFAGKTIEIGADIALNTLSVNENTRLISTTWYPMAYQTTNKTSGSTSYGQPQIDKKEFEGTLDGKRHTVSGIYYLADITTCYGILGNVRDADATVKNISIVDSTVIANRGTAGGIFGETVGANITFSNVYNDIDVIRVTYAKYVTNDDDDNSYGGFIGFADASNAESKPVKNITFDNCVFAGTVDSTVAMTGGFVGQSARNAQVTATNSAFYGLVKGKADGNSVAAIVGRTKDETNVTTYRNVVIAGNHQSPATPLSDCRNNAAFNVTNSVFTTDTWSATHDGIAGVTATAITGSAAIATLKANNFDTTDTWVATVNGMPMPATVAEMVGALEVLELEENYGSAYVGYQTTEVESGTFGVRLIAIIDSLDHADAGFKVTATGTYRNNSTGEDGYSVTKVYESIQAAGVDYAASDFSNQGGYVITLVLNGFDVREGEITFTVETFAGDSVSAVETFTLDTTKVS